MEGEGREGREGKGRGSEFGIGLHKFWDAPPPCKETKSI